MTNTILPAVEIETRPSPTVAVIWMHGLGADGNDFVPLVPELGLDHAALGVRFVFPHAPSMPITCNGGYVMPAWYDILTRGAASRLVDEAGIRASREAVRALIARENARGIPTERIFLAGFSQGAAMTYTVGLTHPQPLAGLIALSGYLPAPVLVEVEFVPDNRGVPIFAAHGSFDEMLPVSMGEQARDQVKALGCDVAWHTYPMEHSVCAAEVAALRAWLATQLAALAGA